MKMTDFEGLKQALNSIKESGDKHSIRGLLIDTARRLPKAAEFLELYKLGYELLNKITDPEDNRHATLDFVKEIPQTDIFLPLYSKAVEDAVDAADGLEEAYKRTTELLRLAEETPKTDKFLNTRLRAWRLAMNLPDKPRQKEAPLDKIAGELPKTSDVSFFKRYTLLGIAKEMPKEGAFAAAYREAISCAIKAVPLIEEPFYRKYALIYIARDIPKKKEFAGLYEQAITETFKATIEIKDPFARQHALIELLQEVPKTIGFFPLLQDVIEQSLSFFTVRKWMGDIEVFDVVDYILSAEELGIKESKKKRFSREKYADILSKELEKLAPKLNDTRFIETLKPYTHVWVQPKGLREAVKKVVDRLEGLAATYHGREIERPLFVKEHNPASKSCYVVHKKEPADIDCVSIDLGATNTVIMRKKGGSQPDFVQLPVARRHDGAFIIPTVLSAETNSIGAEVNEEFPITNIKQMLLEGNPKAKEHMDRFFRILYQHLKKAAPSPGWFSIIPKNLSDVIYFTVPVGYTDYKNSLKEIVERHAKGAKVEFIEEPLAAAMGYQVVEDRDKVVLIIDFGGSTLNTMLVRLNVNEVHIVAKPERAQVLGGRDIDVWLAEHLSKKAGIPHGNIPYRLISRAEEIKIELSKKNEAAFVWEGREASKVTREEFEEVLDEHDFYKLIDRTISYVLKRAEKVGLRKDKIEAVLLTGGSSQIPSFREKIGHIFPNLRRENLIYDHSPLTAVGQGAALYGTREITDRHLGLAYAIRYSATDKDATHSFSIVLEKGTALPVEKTFRVRPAKKLGLQNEIYVELFEVPESLIARKWVIEGGIEFLKQELKQFNDLNLTGLKTVTLPYKEPIEIETEITLAVDGSGHLSVIYGPQNTVIETGVRLQ